MDRYRVSTTHKGIRRKSSTRAAKLQGYTIAKSSINFAKASKGGFKHNDRSQSPDYLLPKEYHLGNEVDLSAKEAEEKMKSLYENAKENHIKHTGQKLQATSYKWEAVINLNKEHTLEDVQKLTKDLEKETGFTSVQIAIHRDEGRVIQDKKGKDVPIHNYHAHVTFFTLDRETGVNLYRKDITKRDRTNIEKHILDRNPNIRKGDAQSEERKAFNKLVKEEIQKRDLKVMDSKRLSKLQTITAKSLNMERGKVSVKEEAKRLGVELDKNPAKRLDHKQYKQVEKNKELVKAKELKEKFKTVRENFKENNANRGDYAKLEQLKKELDLERKDKKLTKEKLDLALKEIVNLKTNNQEIKEENTYLKEHIKEKNSELTEIKEQYKDLKKDYNILKEKYIQLKSFVKELPNNILENTKQVYKDVLEKIIEFKQERVGEKDMHKNKNNLSGKDKEIADLKEQKERLLEQQQNKEKTKERGGR